MSRAGSLVRLLLVMGAIVCGRSFATGDAPPDVAIGDPAAVDREARTIVSRYLEHPGSMRRELIAFARAIGPAAPPQILLLVGDAYVRGAQVHAAERVFAAVLERDAGPEWTGWASLGLGWLAAATGRFDTARPHYERVAAGSWNREVGVVGLGLLDAAEGHGDRAVSRLSVITSAPPAMHRLREVALLEAAYARYWSGDFAAAASAFRVAADVEPDGSLADDATYGAGWSLLRSGDRPGALELLRPLARSSSFGINPKRIPATLLRLQPGAVLRASLKRYRNLRFGEPAEQLAALLDGDGSALARAALASLGEAEPPTAASDEGVEKVPAPAVAARPRPDTGPETRPAAVPPAGSSAEAHPVAFPWATTVAGLAALAAVVWLLSRRRPREELRPR